jgi:hypothetical protein
MASEAIAIDKLNPEAAKVIREQMAQKIAYAKERYSPELLKSLMDRVNDNDNS